MLIKSGQDANFYDVRFNAASVAEFTSRGIAVLAWPYITPAGGTAAADAAARALTVPGVSGLVLDVEAEWESGDNSQAATDLCTRIREKAGAGAFVGYTSFGWVGYHAPFPFHEFETGGCGSAFFPQVYWSDRGVTWTHGYDQAVQMIAAAGLTAPVWIIQSNDDGPGGGAPSTPDLVSFFDKAGPYSSLWEYPAKGLAAKVAQLGALAWGN